LIEWRHDFTYYSSSRFYFTFELFSFLRPPGVWGSKLLLGIKVLGSLCLCLGLFLPYSTWLLLLSYSYLFLLDKARYNNHFYLSTLFLFLFAVLDGHHAYSLDQYLGLGRPMDGRMPAWELWIFRLQVLIVYVYGGLNKCQYDWLLRAMPMRKWFMEFQGSPQWQGRLYRYTIHPQLNRCVESLMKQPVTAYLFSWGGAIVDLSVIFLLIYPPTFGLGLGLYLLFSVFNHWFFKIGCFPYINYAALLLFIDLPLSKIGG
jgi:hypothetical protein